VSARLVATLESLAGALRPRHRDAFLAVERARFVRAVDADLADENTALPLDTPHGARVPPMAALVAQHGSIRAAILSGAIGAAGATISQPLVYAIAFAALALDEGDRYLELGAGSGYGLALARAIVGASGEAVGIEVDPFLAERARTLAGVEVLHADGLERGDRMARASACWVTFSVETLPTALVDALPEGARLLVPLGPPPPHVQQLKLLHRKNGALVEHNAGPMMFIPARPLIAAR
jgi:protein-L-isoaspartate(D-aspartate) O-methyltransferase